MSSSQEINYTYSESVVEILHSIKSTLLMSTYESGKIMLFGGQNKKFDIRYKNFPRPMGLFYNQGKLFAGLGHGIHTFSNFSAVAKNLGNNEDACFLPSNVEYTGNIDIHEMEYIDNRLYFINTKFSCLCIKEPNTSFKPIWKPSFITSLQPTDKCHLNGFCSRDNEPRYITALGESDEPLGWRSNKQNGGILIDIKTNEILARGLSMPHSPRWHNNELFLLESGKGAISKFNFETKKVETITTVPGFTRGLQIVGKLAFIGVSKVRESATFSGLDITKLEKRVAGVWIVDLVQGKTVGFIEFDSGIDEVFAVTLLPHEKAELFDSDSEHSHINYMIAPEDINDIKMPEKKIEMAAPHFEKGNDLFNLGKKEEAIKEFEKALQIDPSYLPATFNLAICLGDLERFKEAEEILEEVKEKDASIIETYDSLAYVNYKQGNFQEARENYLKILELDKENIKAKRSLEILEKQKSIQEETSIKFVYQKLTQKEKEEIQKLWIKEGVVSQEEGEKRVEEVSTLLLKNEKIIGVTTVYTEDFPDLGEYYYFRMFIEKAFRGDNKLRNSLVKKNFQELKKLQDSAKGVLIEVENQKLQKLEKKSYLKRRGYEFYKTSEKGLPMWYVDFDSPTGIFNEI